jgi:Caspase domain
MLHVRFATPLIRGSLCKVLCLIVVIALSAIAEAQSAFKNKHALLIGIGSYAPPMGATPVADSRFPHGGTWNNLAAPPNDVAAMQRLLRERFDFGDIRELTDERATRQGILGAIDTLIEDTHPGDLVVIYYSGHSGGLRHAETGGYPIMVPADSWKGGKDILDAELAALFKKIVHEKHAHLTAIFDGSTSGTIATGIAEGAQQGSQFDHGDIAKKLGAVTEADLKKPPPQQGDVVILAGASPNQSAIEAAYPEDRLFHGAFTRALIQVLRQNSQALSAEDVLSSVSNILRADPVPFQQPTLEGSVKRSLFGDPVSSHRLHTSVVEVNDGKIILDAGFTAGFGVETKLTSLEADGNGSRTVITVTKIDSPVRSTAQVINGPGNVRPGQIFEVSSFVYPQAARLIVFASQAAPIPTPSGVASVKALFPSLTWVDDPADGLLNDGSLDYLVMNAGGRGWLAYGRHGHPFNPGPDAKGKAFLVLGPPPSVIRRIGRAEPFQREAFQFTDNPTEANYILTLRLRTDGSPEYALFLPKVLAGTDKNNRVRSVEEDPDEMGLNDGRPPEVVCQTDSSIPIRTAWLHDATALATEDSIVPALLRRILRLGKLRAWLQLPSFSTGISDWPYHLRIAQDTKSVTGPLHAGEKYEIRLESTSVELSSKHVSPKYIYLLGFDCAANPYVLYPRENLSGLVPSPGLDGAFPLTVQLVQEQVGPPFGADTLLLLATDEKINDLSLLTYDGVIETRGRATGLDQLMIDVNDAGSRGISTILTNWEMQVLVVQSRP